MASSSWMATTSSARRRVTLFQTADAAVLVDGQGRELARWVGTASQATRSEGLIFFVLGVEAGEEVHRFDLATGVDTRVIEGRDIDLRVDPTGRYVAIALVPPGRSESELHAGRL